MKQLKYFFGVVLALAFTSCSDAIDITQKGEIDNEVTFQSVEDLATFLNGDIYGRLGNSNEILFTAVFTDECGIGPNNGGQERDLHQFVLNQSTGYASGIWASHYGVINRVNRLLQAASTITPVVDDTVDETEQYNSILAEAKALRAYAYFQLLTYYSTDLSDDNALGVMLFEDVPPIDVKLPRSTNGAVFQLIESDLAYAEANLVDRTGAIAYKYVSINMINAMRARMYLYRKNYTLAKQYAQAVVNSGPALTIATPYVAANFYNENTTSNPYRRIWADLSQGETIFALARPAGGGGGNIAAGFFFNTTMATGGAFLDMGRNLFDELNAVSGDIRRLAFVDPSSIIATDPLALENPNTEDVLIIDKYPGKPTQPLKNDIKIFRMSEMYFILAECAVAENQLPIAAGYIKNIRDARNRLAAQPLPVYADEQQAWADILKERRKELCFEGHRYIDIKRLGTVANKSIDRSIIDDIILTLPTTISNTDYRFTLPIPQDEIAGNPNIQQNPGYN